MRVIPDRGCAFRSEHLFVSLSIHLCVYISVCICTYVYLCTLYIFMCLCIHAYEVLAMMGSFLCSLYKVMGVIFWFSFKCHCHPSWWWVSPSITYYWMPFLIWNSNHKPLPASTILFWAYSLLTSDDLLCHSPSASQWNVQTTSAHYLPWPLTDHSPTSDFFNLEVS